MKERLASTFPFVLAAALPLVGFVLALTRFAEDQREEAAYIGLAAILGCVIYALIFLA